MNDAPCPDCGTQMIAIEDGWGSGKLLHYCPVALRALRLGLIGQPGRKHKECRLWRFKGDFKGSPTKIQVSNSASMEQEYRRLTKNPENNSKNDVRS